MKRFLKYLVCFLFSASSYLQAENCEQESSYCCQEFKTCDNEGCTLGANYYAKILGGVNVLNKVTADRNRSTYQAGYVISGSIGCTFCYGFSLEGEYAFRRNTIRKIHFFGNGSSTHGHFQTSSLMANLLWDLPLPFLGCSFWNTSAYIGAGMGYDFQQLSSSNSRIVFKQKWNHFSWQLMTGLKLPIFCNTELSLEYKFHQGGCHFNNHSLGFGLVYNFSL